ncbi:MetS family NSS transporter small subunit [Fulvivirga sedimenti]|uniref:MetS family NSS transporter small subunit n=1 Tax=Fulvivirga sedimenti TaxID=2879465 RepID=A0A9X1HVB4_9BACT|nr:MetS family NSS transporter small subunit [Fulvivirga sedimenti]MCA6078025.1 MetS family NSS transporter small subunit [Fulvivirga sedimenti]
MSTLSIITMILIILTVVGGFIYFLTVAIRKENEKNRDQEVS